VNALAGGAELSDDVDLRLLESIGDVFSADPECSLFHTPDALGASAGGSDDERPIP
jgi:hypothetical protein